MWLAAFVFAGLALGTSVLSVGWSLWAGVKVFPIEWVTLVLAVVFTWLTWRMVRSSQ